MTRDQETILWLGLILVALNLIVHIGDFKKVLFGGPVNAPTVNIPGTSIPNPFGSVPNINIPGVGPVPIPVNETFPTQTPPPSQVTLQ